MAMRMVWCVTCVIIVVVDRGIGPAAVVLNYALSGVCPSDSGVMSATVGSWPKPVVTLSISLSVDNPTR